MRILRLIPYFSDPFGGPVRHAKMLTEKLERMGHETVIFTTNLGDRFGNSPGPEDNGFEVRSFPVRWRIGDFFYTPGLKRALAAERFDIVHGHGYRNYQSDCAAWISRKSQKPLVFSAHGTIPKLPGMRDFVLKGLYDLSSRGTLLRRSGKVIALARAEVAQYVSAGVPREKIVLIHHGVDTELFRPQPCQKGVQDGWVIFTYFTALHQKCLVLVNHPSTSVMTRDLCNVILYRDLYNMTYVH